MKKTTKVTCIKSQITQARLGITVEGQESDTTALDGKPRKLIPLARVRSPLHSLDSVEVEAFSIPADNPRPRLASNEFVLDIQSDDENEEEYETDGEFNMIPLSVSPSAEEAEKKSFDLMNITITLYGITGITCEEKKKQPHKLVRKVSILKGSKSRDSSQFSDDNHSARSEIQSRSTSSCTGSGPKPFILPITVAASVKRNTISSQSVIETFFPSQPMKVSRFPSKSETLSARWQSPADVLLRDSHGPNENEHPDIASSFHLLRMMMRKPYSRNDYSRHSAGVVDNYVHEHVQIGINLCRGKELMRLGVATLIVTGEEEGQVMMHVPVKMCANPGIFEKKTASSSKKENGKGKKKNKKCFEDDNRVFRLDENASLHLGVQVHSQRDIDAAKQYKEVKKSDSSSMLRAAHATKISIYEHQKQMEALATRPKISNAVPSQIVTDKKVIEVLGENNNNNIQHFQKNKCNESHQIYKNGENGKHNGNYMSSSELNQKSTNVKSSTKPQFRHTEALLSRVMCGTALPPEMMPGGAAGIQRVPSTTNASLNLTRTHSVPVSEIINVKYDPAYAKSMFSGISTFSHTEVSEDDLDISLFLEEAAKNLAEA